MLVDVLGGAIRVVHNSRFCREATRLSEQVCRGMLIISLDPETVQDIGSEDKDVSEMHGTLSASSNLGGGHLGAAPGLDN